MSFVEGSFRSRLSVIWETSLPIDVSAVRGPETNLRSRRKCVFVLREKYRERERTKIERATYVQKGQFGERETTRRERRERERESVRTMVRRVDAFVRYVREERERGEGGGRRKRGEMIKRDVRFDGCSLSPRIVHRCRCIFFFSLFLYLVVPFPNFTLQIPLLTLTKVDAVVIHLANLLQLHYKEYGESLRNLWFLDVFAFCFFDSLGNTT